MGPPRKRFNQYSGPTDRLAIGGRRFTFALPSIGMGTMIFAQVTLR
jgi:hypothetical protein